MFTLRAFKRLYLFFSCGFIVKSAGIFFLSLLIELLALQNPLSILTLSFFFKTEKGQAMPPCMANLYKLLCRSVGKLENLCNLLLNVKELEAALSSVVLLGPTAVLTATSEADAIDPLSWKWHKHTKAKLMEFHFIQSFSISDVH